MALLFVGRKYLAGAQELKAIESRKKWRNYTHAWPLSQGVLLATRIGLLAIAFFPRHLKHAALAHAAPCAARASRSPRIFPMDFKCAADFIGIRSPPTRSDQVTDLGGLDTFVDMLL